MKALQESKTDLESQTKTLSNQVTELKAELSFYISKQAEDKKVSHSDSSFYRV